MELPKASELVGIAAGLGYVWSSSPGAAWTAWDARTSTMTIGGQAAATDAAPCTERGPRAPIAGLTVNSLK